jgi:hypothetical protein
MSSHNVYEDELEQAALEWFEELGYETAFAPDISSGGDYPERSDYSKCSTMSLAMALTRCSAPTMASSLDHLLLSFSFCVYS